jgi:rubrerythrin
MRELFDVAEIVRIAVEDETSGVAFYEQVAQNSSNPDLKNTFANLAGQERYHKKRFETMLESLGARAPREEYAGEYADYLRTLTEGRAFPDAQAAQRMANQCAGDAEAIDLACRFERDTLILMNEMKGLLPEEDLVIVNEIIREEQSHLVALADARRVARSSGR